MRYIMLTVLLPALALAHEVPAVPDGHMLVKLPPGEFQSYVSGIYEGHLVMAEALKVPQLVCVGPALTRTDLALIVRGAISRLPGKAMLLPARSVVFRVLIEKLPCPGVRWERPEPAY